MNSLYYRLKPLIPWSLRLAGRRWLAQRLRQRHCSWPIDPVAGESPVGWPGWPDGKQFALVLTHDIEGKSGLHKCQALAETEMRLGFRSSFNFVPEGEYVIPEPMVTSLRDKGFEIGIHDLHHDGSLYRSAGEFIKQASTINYHLQFWNAVGFRSGYMFHNLEWLQKLNVLYDSSTFDIDPFEPQPDGVRTIFPFWVPGENERGFVELPYTLPQDSTLFLLLNENSIDLWVKKLDWVASHGGMVLLNTHPDYMCFGGQSQAREYPVRFYEEFLSYVKEKYQDAYWHALPRDVASFYRKQVPHSTPRARKAVCMLVYNTYETDNRVRRYAETLAACGDEVEVIAIGDGQGVLGQIMVNGVRVHRIQQRVRDERSKWTYAWRLVRFLLVSSIYLARLHHHRRFDVVHVHNIPDFLVFAALYPKWSGARVILDIHDLVPELFADKFEASNWYVHLLKQAEKASAAFADHVIVSNHLWRDKLIRRSVPKEKCTVFLNHVDASLFYQRKRTRTDDKCIVLFPGTFQWHQGLDIAIEALGYLKEKLSKAELHLYGGGGSADTERNLVQLAERLGIKERVKFCGRLSLDQIPQVIADADLGIVPKRADSFGNEAYSTKIMEFMSQGVPVVVSRTKIDELYFNDTVVRFFESGNPKAMAEAMLEVLGNPSLRRAMVANAYEYIERHSWDTKKKEYLLLVGHEDSVDLVPEKAPALHMV